MPTDDAAPTTPFSDLDAFIALPRVDGIALSPDGTRVALTVSTLNAERTGYVRSIWSVPIAGDGAPVRLTRSAKGEGGVAFTRDGDVLFVSARPDADAATDTEQAQVWRLPSAGGEARAITRLAGGAGSVAAVAADADTIVVSADLLPAAAGTAAGRAATSGAGTGGSDLERDAELRARRKDLGVSAILHESYPVRYWDHDLGPDEPHLLALDLGALVDELAVGAPDAVPGTAAPDEVAAGAAGTAPGATAVYPTSLPRPRDLTPAPGRSLDHGVAALTPDGATLILGRSVPEARSGRSVIVSIDVATGTVTTLFDEPGVHHESPVVSHDGTRIAWVRSEYATPAGPTAQEVWVADIDGGHARRVAAAWDRWPTQLLFDVGDRALLATADQDGRGPVFRLSLAQRSATDDRGTDDRGTPSDAVEQVTHDDFTYSSIAVDAATGLVVALRSSWLTPAHPVRIDPDGTVTALPTPAPLPDVPARMEEVNTTAEDGTRVRGWLVLPTDASPADPAPFLLWIHGGPLNSWNAWSWRWTPMLAVAQGYAVLLPDPALSTGYGLDFIARGWNAWGQAPYTDLMAITDAVVAREDIDETRTAAMGGSFGGYMANWVAGHTDRFRAIVTHASLWALDQFSGTTDSSDYWQSIFTPEGLHENDPHRFVADIVTPMLVVHGDHDYRVPIGEGLRLWSELAEHHAAADGTMDHRFLYFPDENHWILKPQHAKVWYQTVFAFLAQHVRGEAWERPALLG